MKEDDMSKRVLNRIAHSTLEELEEYHKYIESRMTPEEIIKMDMITSGISEELDRAFNEIIRIMK